MRFDAAPFRDALSCSLELLGTEPLREAADEHGRPVWTFPALDARAATDPSWAATLDTLRAPRKTGQKLTDWRREAPMRPVVFEDAGVLTEDDRPPAPGTAGRAAASRAASVRRASSTTTCRVRAWRRSADSIPRVILLGRLSLYGQRAERLHEQLVPVAARWMEPTTSGTSR